MEVSQIFFNNLKTRIIDFINNENYELEAKCKLMIDQERFTNTLKYILSTKYKPVVNSPLESIDISVDFQNESYRISVIGQENMQYYCKNNTIENADDIIIINKKRITGKDSIKFEEAHFNIDLREENKVDSLVVKNILNNLKMLDKKYRLKKRYSYIDNSGYFRLDLTIVKSFPKKFKNFVQANLGDISMNYEIEIEILRPSKKLNNLEITDLTHNFLNIISTISNVVLGSELPILPKVQQDLIFKKYLQLCNFDKNQTNLFGGPQPITLELKNMIDPDLGVITIKENYTVTEKADGERALLFIDDDGKCYFINSRLNVKYIGIQIEDSNFKNSLFDGEFITKNKKNEAVKIFAIFDVYWCKKEDKRKLPLVVEGVGESRFKICSNFAKKIGDKNPDFKIIKKEFYFVSESDTQNTIFHHIRTLLEKKFEYKIDGLIFTPQKLPVGGSYLNDEPNNTGTWDRVFKWKPPEENTIDFLVEIDSNSTQSNSKIYKILNLYVGYNPLQWEPITSIQYMTNKIIRNSEYIKKEFIPGDVNDPTFAQCYLEKLECKNKDIIKSHSIVEMSYDSDSKLSYPFRWKPLRVRKDKTELLQIKLSGTANDYKTAMNIWRSINYPVTREIITGVEQKTKKDIIEDDDVYYYRATSRNKFATKNMLDFHNIVIKSEVLFGSMKTLFSESKTELSLIDLSCGKGGDIPKWINTGISKVLGIDISRDNIENGSDGAYARTIQRVKDKNYKYIYVSLDSSKKLNQEYISTISNESDKIVYHTIWGLKDGDQNSKYYNFVQDKFNIVSCQFSLHYFFENETKFKNFMWNVNEYIKENGYFIGTCLDGSTVRNSLSKIKKGESITGKINDRVLWNIKKLYTEKDKDIFGQEIEIFMESIGKVAKEYLVDFKVLEDELKTYNIRILPFDELKKIDLSQSYDSFESSYEKSNERFKLSDEEKEYSFMNNWFIFKKYKEEVESAPTKKKLKLKTKK